MELKNKRILVTGGTGFLGQALCLEMQDRGLEPIIVSRGQKHPIELLGKCKQYDLMDRFSVKQMMIHCKPEIIIHLAAACGGIGANQENPGRYFYENMQMGLNVIEAAREFHVEKFVQVGTICAYPKFTPIPFKEEDLWNGYPEETNAPYGIAKKALLVMLQAYRQQYNMNGIYLLPVNLYGPRDNFDLFSSHVIPALIRKFAIARDNKEQSVKCWGTGSPSREFLYVDDCARGILAATEHYDKPDPINLGNGREIAIGNLAELIKTAVGYQGEIVWDPSKPDGQPKRCLDTEKAKKEFGWSAEVDLEEGIRRTYEWFHKVNYA